MKIQRFLQFFLRFRYISGTFSAYSERMSRYGLVSFPYIALSLTSPSICPITTHASFVTAQTSVKIAQIFLVVSSNRCTKFPELIKIMSFSWYEPGHVLAMQHNLYLKWVDKFFFLSLFISYVCFIGRLQCCNQTQSFRVAFDCGCAQLFHYINQNEMHLCIHCQCQLFN